MKKSFTLLACAALLAAAVAVQAQPAGQGGPMMGGQNKDKMLEGSEHYMSRQGYMRMDTDKDGKVSREEFMVGCQERFDVIDSNRDGFISQDEVKAVHSRARKGMGGQYKDMPARGGQMEQQKQ